MKTEKQFSLERDEYGVYYQLKCLNDNTTEVFTREELRFLGVSKLVLSEFCKHPVTFKLTIEVLCE